jgi:hypothetical protein
MLTRLGVDGAEHAVVQNGDDIALQHPQVPRVRIALEKPVHEDLFE